nr:porin [Pseudomonas sp. FFPRI_1]
MLYKRSGLLCNIALLGSLATPALAVQVTDHLDLGGAVRARWDYDPDRDIQTFNFDTAILSAKYSSDTWIGAAKYRFYGRAYPYRYTDNMGDIAFAESAWIGYRFNPEQQVQVGLNQIPFGLQPYFGSTFFETLGNVVGLEDIQQIGAKYIQQSGDWNLQAGYYLRPIWQGKGTSNGRTYSSVVSSADSYVADGSDNRERNTLVLRVARAVPLGDWTSEVGVSGLTSTLKNNDTHNDGRRNAMAVHYRGKNGPWGVQLQAARQQMSPRNPGTDELITLGGYDGTFNVASRGNLYVADLSYDVDGKYLSDQVSGVKLYANYSAFDKSASAYKTSQRMILGSSFSLSKLWIATEWLFGKNDPYIGGSSYAQSLGAGGSNQWENQVYVNIGYYF